MKKAQGITLDMNGRRAPAQGVVVVTLSRLSKAVKSIRIRKLSTKTAKPKGNARLHAELKRRHALNLKEGTRRLALLLGVAGAILGGFASYLELQTVLSQRTDHIRLEQLANSDVVQHARRSIEISESGASQNPAPAKFDWSAVEVCPLDASDNAGCTTDVARGDIKTIHWAKGLVVKSIEASDGQTLYSTPAPSAWMYCLIALLPILGFLIPWGAVRAIGWVGAGFVAGPK
jgi:hypothetical protein